MVRSLTDSTCDIPPQRQKELDIEVVPLSVHFGPETYQDGVDLTNQEFYAKLRQAETLPTTSQVNPEEFARRFQAHLDQGNEVVGLFIASQLSGTCQSAAIARDMVDGEGIYVLDSTTVTFGLGLMVETACILRDRGLGGREIYEELERLTRRLRFYAVAETLKYLKMGGRISAATAMVGGMLGITPILNIRDGVVEAAGKSRGRKAAYQWMEKRIADEPVDTSLPVSFGHSDQPAVMAECEAYFLERIPGMQIVEGDIGSVVGTHIGPGAVGIAYFTKE